MQLYLTQTIKSMLIAFVGIFLCQHLLDQVLGGAVLGVFALIPSKALFGGYIWQFITYSFLHADVLHLLLNGLVLAFLGSEIESLWGRKRFVAFYFTCVLGAGVLYVLFQVLFSGTNGPGMMTPLLGASGGMYGLLIAYGILFSERTLLFMMIFPMKAKHFIWVLAGVELLSSITGRQGGLSSIAHLGGMGVGFLLVRYPDGFLGVLRRRSKGRGFGSGRGFGGGSRGGAGGSGAGKKSHLRIVKDEEPTKKDDKTWH